MRERLGFKPDMHTSKIDPRHVGYTWVPPGIMTSSKVFSEIFRHHALAHTHTHHPLTAFRENTPTHKNTQIQRYFDSLPEDKVPKIGSTGERHRDKQLAFQLPKQDLSLAYCKHVEPNNQSSYEDFVAARNEIALDIGM